jgi:uncharacterized membrane protein
MIGISMLLPAALPLLWGCTAVETSLHAAGEPAGRPRAANAATFVFECPDGYSFVARIEGETAWLFLPSQTVSLPQVPSGSGVKYSSAKMTFWSKGEQAFIEMGRAVHRDCSNNRAAAIWEHAKLGGVDFRAAGNEPGWYLEISRGAPSVLVTDYGRQRYPFATPEPATDISGRKTVYTARSNGHDLRVTLHGRQCRDTMSGELFEAEVVVDLDDRTLRGCGRPLH